MMQSLAQNAQYLAPAAKAVPMFARFPGPPGRYFCRLVRITGRPDKKTGTPIITFAFVTIANCETRSQDYANQPIRIQFWTSGSKNQTSAEQWARLFTEGYQALGIPTADWPDDQAIIMQNLIEATAMLNKAKYPVVIEVRTSESDGKTYTNFNIREVLNEDAVKGFAEITVNITDEQINADDPLPQIGDEALAADEAFKAKFSQAEQFIANMSVDQLIKELGNMNVEVENPASKTASQLRHILLREFVLTSDRNPEDFGLGDAPFDTTKSSDSSGDASESMAPTGDSSAPTGVGGSSGASGGIVEEDDDPALIEEEDDAPMEFTLEQEATQKAMMLPTRQSIQLAILKYGEQKFVKSQTDDMLRQLLVQKTVAAGNLLW